MDWPKKRFQPVVFESRRFVRLEAHAAVVGTMPHAMMASDTSLIVGIHHE